MGVISKKLASRFRKARRQLGELRRQAAVDFAQVPKDVKGVERRRGFVGDEKGGRADGGRP